MTQQQLSEQDGDARLLGVVGAADELSCAQAQAMLRALVEARHSGEEIDVPTEFATLLRHLDRCADCRALYAQLSADITALIDDTEPLPSRAALPTLGPLVVQGGNTMVRLLRGLRRRFAITLSVPQWQQDAIGELQQRTLFSGTLDTLAGTPTVEVQLRQQDTRPVLRVGVRDLSSDIRWRMLLMQGGQAFSAIADAQGVAQFVGFDVAALRDAARIELLVSEEPAP